MEFNQVQNELKAMGTAQNCKIYIRHGAPADNVFGVSFANLGKLQKKIKQDHALARELWQSGNYDSCNLAAKIADGQQMDEREVNAWLASLDNYIHVSLLGGLIAAHPQSHKLALKLYKETDEIRCGLGHSIISSNVSRYPERLTEKQLMAVLSHMEKNIHKRENWARYSMNWCLIAIGTYAPTPELKERAVAAAKKIGKVEVDHGETSCKTPDAAPYIEKAYKHQQEKLAKQRAKEEAKRQAKQAKA